MNHVFDSKSLEFAGRLLTRLASGCGISPPAAPISKGRRVIRLVKDIESILSPDFQGLLLGAKATLWGTAGSPAKIVFQIREETLRLTPFVIIVFNYPFFSRGFN